MWRLGPQFGGGWGVARGLWDGELAGQRGGEVPVSDRLVWERGVARVVEPKA